MSRYFNKYLGQYDSVCICDLHGDIWRETEGREAYVAAKNPVAPSLNETGPIMVISISLILRRLLYYMYM